MPALVERAKAAVAGLRRQYPALDHLVLTVAHYNRMQGRNLAGAVTYFGFLSLFPLIAIAYAALSYVVRVYPPAQELFTEWLAENLPGLTGPEGLDVDAIAAGGTARLGAGLGGAAGLVYSGLGALDALRASLRRMWGVAPVDANIVVKKTSDLLVLLLLGTTVLAATATSSLTTAFTDQVLDLLGLASSAAAGFGVQVLAIVLAVLADTGVLIVVFARLPGHRLPWRNVWTGALLGAVGIEVLKQLATVLLTGTSTNPVYGAFAGLITVLVWINLICRVVMYAAAWSVTGPVPTVEAEVAAHGETLDAEAADAVEQARNDADDPGLAGVPVPGGHRTTAGSVEITTTGVSDAADDREQRVADAAGASHPVTQARGRGAGSSRPSLLALAGVAALVIKSLRARRERRTVTRP